MNPITVFRIAINYPFDEGNRNKFLEPKIQRQKKKESASGNPCTIQLDGEKKYAFQTIAKK